MIIIDVIGNYQTPGEVTCPLTYFGYDHELNLFYLVHIIPSALLSTVMTIGSVYVFEFVCNQARIYMSGILSGVYWFLLTTLYSIGALTELPFVLTTLQGPGKLSCLFWNLFL